MQDGRPTSLCALKQQRSLGQNSETLATNKGEVTRLKRHEGLGRRSDANVTELLIVASRRIFDIYHVGTTLDHFRKCEISYLYVWVSKDHS